MNTILRYVLVLLGWLFSWLSFSLVYGQIDDISNTYLSTFGLLAPLLLLPAFAFFDARFHSKSWRQGNTGKYLGLSWLFGAVGYFPILLIIVGIMWGLFK
jgi:hypothetical protein